MQKIVDIIRGVCYITYALAKKGYKALKKCKKEKKLLTKFGVDVIVYLRDAKVSNARNDL